MIITCAACSVHACGLLLPGPLPRAVRPSPSSVRKAVITLVLHSTIMSLHVSQLHVSQLHAVGMRAQTRAQPR